MIRVVEFKVKPLRGQPRLLRHRSFSLRKGNRFGAARDRNEPRSCRLACMSKLRIAGVIPARLGSTRLPRKVLRELAGRPMVEWVWRAAAGSGLMDPVVVATDSDEVAEICLARGVPVAMTSPNCASGSYRVREVARRSEA